MTTETHPADIVDRIDDAVTGWEARPEAWNPGDPLWERPAPWLDEGAQYIRPMFQVIEDCPDEPRCGPCQVSWRGNAPCWLCGETRRPTWLEELELDDYEPAPTPLAMPARRRTA